ncbi:hypothetical protein, partial [Alkalihalobacillus pseudalcaliphilus]|uniref:hypothetical protein n=1 Tax=Alkalihalobacillus pseudalcaliphilus TaxID=79884 RepID=UPI002361D283
MEPPYTEPYVRWCGGWRLVASFYPDCSGGIYGPNNHQKINSRGQGDKVLSAQVLAWIKTPSLRP